MKYTPEELTAHRELRRSDLCRQIYSNDPWTSYAPDELALILNPMRSLADLAWHHAECYGDWKIAEVVSDFPAQLTHSDFQVLPDKDGKPVLRYNTLVIQISELVFIGFRELDPSDYILHVWADSHEKVEATLMSFNQKYCNGLVQP